MALEDPFFVVKDEVLKALLKTRDLFESWRLGQECLASENGGDGFLRTAEEQEWATTELRNSLRSIEWDLEDLDDTVQIVEKNPAKFRIDSAELSVRKAFIQQTRDEVNRMKEWAENPEKSKTYERSPMDTIPLASPSTPASGTGSGGPGLLSHSSSINGHSRLMGGSGGVQSSVGGGMKHNNKYSRLPSNGDGDYAEDDDYSPTSNSAGGLSNSNSQYIQQQIAAQDRLMASQDSRLDMMSETMGTLRNVGGAIGQELDEQAVMLDEFGTEIENAESKLDATMRKMAKVLHMSNDRRQWMAIGALSSAMLIIIILLFGL